MNRLAIYDKRTLIIAICCLVVLLVIVCVTVALWNSMSEAPDIVDDTPLVSIDNLLIQLKSSDMETRWEAVYQLGRHGSKAAGYLPELRELYNKNQDEYEDPILAKAIMQSLDSIMQSKSAAYQKIISWGNEWVLAHPAEAAKRGYKLTP